MDTNEYYKVIIPSLVINIDERISLTTDEYNRILKVFSNISNVTSINRSVKIIYISYYRIQISICKSDDEWWYVCFDIDGEKIFYKCDQMDGLIKFLKDTI